MSGKGVHRSLVGLHSPRPRGVLSLRTTCTTEMLSVKTPARLGTGTKRPGKQIPSLHTLGGRTSRFRSELDSPGSHRRRFRLPLCEPVEAATLSSSLECDSRDDSQSCSGPLNDSICLVVLKFEPWSTHTELTVLQLRILSEVVAPDLWPTIARAPKHRLMLSYGVGEEDNILSRREVEMGCRADINDPQLAHLIIIRLKKASSTRAAQASRNVPLTSPCIGQRSRNLPATEFRRQRTLHGPDYVLLDARPKHVVAAATRRPRVRMLTNTTVVLNNFYVAAKALSARQPRPTILFRQFMTTSLELSDRSRIHHW